MSTENICTHDGILCPKGFGLQDHVPGGLKCDDCGEMVINDVAACMEKCGCSFKNICANPSCDYDMKFHGSQYCSRSCLREDCGS